MEVAVKLHILVPTQYSIYTGIICIIFIVPMNETDFLVGLVITDDVIYIEEADLLLCYTLLKELIQKTE